MHLNIYLRKVQKSESFNSINKDFDQGYILDNPHANA